MALPGQPPMTPPAAPAAGPAPGAAPAAGANPLAALSGMGGGGGFPRGQDQLMAMMAGMGLLELLRQMDKMKPKQAGGKSALGKDAAANPAQTQVGPQLLAQLAARRAQMQGGAPGAAAGGQPNPLAALMGR